MVTIVLAIALLVALAGLGLEIGIASWNIRRANRYQRREAAAEHMAEQVNNQREDIARRLESLDDYAFKISWLLNFLYKRYNQFVDIEKEVNDGLNGVTGDTSIGEADGRYKDLQKALKLIRVTVKTADRLDSLMNSISSQLEEIMEDLREGDEKIEVEKSSENKKEETLNPEISESESESVE